ncbi:hypothetical protein FPV67DRAFT_1671562 [Lyophyllum atratum]|nr:hypothetical protein FPV67DRAFT_1671562 [Lyophyllum atratum]
MGSIEGPDLRRPPSRSFARPRSPIPRIKQLLTLRTSPSSRHSPEPPGCPIPTEIITRVGHHTTCLRDVLSVSLTCRRARETLLPRLYTRVELRTNRHCKNALEAFTRHPELAVQYIRTLIVRPNNVERTSAGDHLNEALVAGHIVKIASRMRLLQSFCWDGLEMPDDKLWLALRQFCPRLKSISTGIGSLPVRGSDYLFDFRDLVQFTLAVKCDSLEWLSDGRPTVEKLPRRCWQMLLEHCPNLEVLTIGGPAPSPRLFDTRHVTAGRWPRLRKLTLGDMRLQQPSGPDEKIPEGQALGNFLTAHPHLREVAFFHPGGTGFPSDLVLPRYALPRMTSFSGPGRFIKSLPHPGLIRHLRITTLHHCLSAFPPTYAMLKALPSLTSLTLWIDLSFANRNVVHDDGNIFRSLLECCPQLLHFEVFCFTRPTFHVKEFSAALRRAPQLRSFSLTKMYKSSDEDMHHTAARIAHDNPNIQKFTLRYVQESWLTHHAGRVQQFGEYEILAGSDGLPTGVLAYEWGLKTFGQTYARNYVHVLKSPKTRRGSGSSRLSWSSSSERARSPRPQSVLSFVSFQPSVK